MKDDKYIIDKTLSDFMYYNVEKPCDMMDIFIKTFNEFNVERKKSMNRTTKNVASVIRLCLVFAVISFIFKWHNNLLGVISEVVFAITALSSVIYLQYKDVNRKKVLRDEMSKYSEFLMEVFLYDNQDYEDRYVGSIDWLRFRARCSHYVDNVLNSQG